MARTDGLSKVLEEAFERGWVIARNKNHLIIRFPQNNQCVSISKTASDWRAIRNIEKQIQRSELA